MGDAADLFFRSGVEGYEGYEGWILGGGGMNGPSSLWFFWKLDGERWVFVCYMFCKIVIAGNA